jgi:hypothetical protein
VKSPPERNLIVYDAAVSISAESRIVRVSVHARGAVVTRSVQLPAELPDGEVDLLIGGITPLCDAGSVRADLLGAREVVSLSAGLHVPAETARPGASVEKLAELERKKDRLAAELQELEAERGQLAQLALQPRLRLGGRFEPVDERVNEALAASSLVSELSAKLDERRGNLSQQLRELQHQIDAAALEDAQRSAFERMGTGHPTRQVKLRLGAGGAVQSLDLSYQVPAARWWPVYTLRLSDGGKQAAWWLEALVAQRSGEDWRGVKLSLATADLIEDARLPELPSLRLGRKQPAKKAYRPAPEGLEQMFACYDRAFPKPMLEAPPPPPPKPQPVRAAPPPVRAQPAFSEEQLEALIPPRKSSSLLGGFFAGSGAPAFAPAAAAPAPMAKTMSISVGGGDDYRASPPEPSAIEPGDAWLDFDRLVMAGPDEGRRGRLRLGDQGGADNASFAVGQIESLAPDKVRDPRETRGLFDHLHEAAGSGDVPSDGVPQRITVGVAEAPCNMFYRAVPREAPEVYREARLKNPFPNPLLAGPVDVYVEGSLLLSSEIERIDVGGEMTVGLGVEERIRVARNARVEEGTAGLLGGSVVVDSEITIDLTSSLNREARIEVADRIPVSDEDDLSVTLVSSKPPHAEYSQKERGAPIRKGLSWTLPLSPSGKGQIVFRYKLTFPGKNELAGGNRRE